MNETSLSLLDHLRHSSDEEGWTRLVQWYAPLLKQWLKQYDLQDSDADDLVQEVLLAVSKDLHRFQHNGRSGAFRAWLRTVLVHRVRHFWRSRGRRPRARGDSDWQRQLNELADPNSQLSAMWNRQHDQHVARRLLTETQSQFSQTTWEAFWRVTLLGESADRVAADLKLSPNAVFIAKSRVLRRLRQQAQGLIDASGDFLQID